VPTPKRPQPSGGAGHLGECCAVAQSCALARHCCWEVGSPGSSLQQAREPAAHCNRRASRQLTSQQQLPWHGSEVARSPAAHFPATGQPRHGSRACCSACCRHFLRRKAT